MKKILQTKTGYEDGNCLMACVASILEWDEIVEPWECVDAYGITEEGSYWFSVFKEFMIEQGYIPLLIDAELHENVVPSGYAIASGLSPRSTKHVSFHHSVVVKDGEIVWDPHPTHEGIETIVDYIILFPLVT